MIEVPEYAGQLHSGPGWSSLRCPRCGVSIRLRPTRLVMAEALVCGTPVMAFAAGTGMEIMIGGENGLPVPDEVKMACAVKRLHAHPGKVR